MGAVGSQSRHLRQVNLMMNKLRDDLTLDSILEGVEESSLSDHLKELARIRLKCAPEYIDDSRSLVDVIRPGRLAIVDLRDEFIEKDEALGLLRVVGVDFQGGGQKSIVAGFATATLGLNRYEYRIDLCQGLWIVTF